MAGIKESSGVRRRCVNFNSTADNALQLRTWKPKVVHKAHNDSKDDLEKDLEGSPTKKTKTASKTCNGKQDSD